MSLSRSLTYNPVLRGAVASLSAVKILAFAIAILVAAVVAFPLASLVRLAAIGDADLWPHLAAYVLPVALLQTVLLLLGVAVTTAVAGVSTAWLVSTFQFPGPTRWCGCCHCRSLFRSTSRPMSMWTYSMHLVRCKKRCVACSAGAPARTTGFRQSDPSAAQFCDRVRALSLRLMAARAMFQTQRDFHRRATRPRCGTVEVDARHQPASRTTRTSGRRCARPPEDAQRYWRQRISGHADHHVVCV